MLKDENILHSSTVAFFVYSAEQSLREQLERVTNPTGLGREVVAEGCMFTVLLNTLVLQKKRLTSIKFSLFQEKMQFFTKAR